MTAPRWALRLLARTVDPAEVDDRLGDLEEVHRRRVARHGAGVAALLTGLDAVGVAAAAVGGRLARRLRDARPGGVELRLALRLLRRTPVLSAAAVAALTVGIGLATVGFTVVNAALHPAFPFPAGPRYVDVVAADADTRVAVAPDAELVAGWRAEAVGLDHLARYRGGAANAAWTPGEVERVAALEVEPASLTALGFAPAAGRLLGPDDARPGAAPVVVLGDGLWRRRFGADPGVVGRTVEVAGVVRRVVGVLGPDAVAPAPADLWLALPEEAMDQVGLLGLLTPGADPTMVAAGLAARARGPDGAALRVDVRRPGAGPEGRAAGGLAVALLLGLLAVLAGNVGSLVAARTAARASELSVRSALGASRSRLVGQLVAEVGVLVAAATVLGVAAARWLTAAFVASEGDELPIWMDLSLDLRVAAFVALAALAVTLVAGVWPALAATGRRGPGGLRGGAALGRGHGPLVVAQVAVAVAVLGCAAMVHRGWAGGLAARNPAVPVDRLVVADLTLPPDTPWPPTALLQGLDGAPDVEAATLTTHVPGTDARRGPVELEEASGAALVVARIEVLPGYFSAVAAEPLAGRAFAPDDGRGGAPPVAVVDRAFVEAHLGGGNAVGRRLRWAGSAPGSDPEPWLEIVGVVPDLGVAGADPASTGAVYRLLGATADPRLILRTAVAPRVPPEPALRAALYDVDPAVGVQGVRVLGDALEARRRVYRWMGSLATGAGALVLGLAVLATYALLAFEVTRRTREVGVRVALGASAGAVLRPILARTARRLAAGAVLGSALGALLLALVRATLVLRFPATGTATFPVLAGVVAVAGVLAAWVPARRALAVHPMEALRSE